MDACCRPACVSVSAVGPLSSQVTDFGLSVKKGGVGSENLLKATCGTPIYMGKTDTLSSYTQRSHHIRVVLLKPVLSSLFQLLR
jgi:hypothetical protein